ncbi:hypothetical protein BASA83_009108 [Batrachochytrium salamandrivorans]|nr:hypothetical protein BASA83_009108 [Batrachochytrium salamandrivorans]
MVLDSRLSSDPFWLKLELGHFFTRSLVSRVRLLERSVTKKTPINAICSGNDNDVFTLNVQGAVGKIPSLVLVSSDQTAIQEQILADTTSQTKNSQATTLVCIDGDSANMWRLCIAPKVCHSTIIGHFWVLQGSQFRSIASTWHKISDACAHGCFLDSKKAIRIGILVDTHPFSVDRCILCDQQLLSTSIAHLVVECEQVTGHRIQSGLVPAIQKSRLRLLGRALDLVWRMYILGSAVES